MSMGLNWPERKTPTMREPAGHEKSNGGKLEDDAHRARNGDKKQKRRPGRRMRDQEIIEGKTGASDGYNGGHGARSKTWRLACLSGAASTPVAAQQWRILRWLGSARVSEEKDGGMHFQLWAGVSHSRYRHLHFQTFKTFPLIPGHTLPRRPAHPDGDCLFVWIALFSPPLPHSNASYSQSPVTLEVRSGFCARSR
ncbi:hypothetical protein POX_b02545 [Penicillium oxalicum]|uniref:Uncharacterized protein n=1 Tax=Penicillium oxalicum (strain 114-2 / CGMCC 5302) TaxID=933388 RepID=S7ZP74_PENO1|nr:hypothetical protein POX_b02545 [Penicillium oxalicum]EPS30446.1 hypothetical protein PDE_05397 [Penicillium oxalicum 114-2]KAI2792507.1 hypothetical protein POX_b02545 [Penicillium oxalicum]